MTTPIAAPAGAWTEDDLTTVAKTLWGEARGEGIDGLRAVCRVIANRVRLAQDGIQRRLFGNGSWRAACLAPAQFSCWNDGDPNRARLAVLALAGKGEDGVLFRRCYAVAAGIMAGIDRAELAATATHYVAVTIAPPAWARADRQVATIGRHRFYDLR